MSQEEKTATAETINMEAPLTKDSPLSSEDLQVLQNIVSIRQQAQEQLGRLRHQYLLNEGAVMQELEKIMDAQNSFFATEAEKRGFDPKRFSFDIESSLFSDVELPAKAE